MRRFYSPPENFQDENVVLDEGETRHLRDVLRLRAGDIVSIFDGIGGEFECRVENIHKRSTSLSVVSEIEPPAAESNLDLTICASILKGDKTDFAVQKLVELGVNHFVPMISARCDVKPKDAAKRVDRWRKIAFEAAKQCGRAKLMSIDNVGNFDSLVENMKEKAILFSERDGTPFSITGKPRSLTAFFGPEGGWDDAEIELALENKIDIITLKGRIMKADTAAIAISAILQHHFGDLN